MFLHEILLKFQQKVLGIVGRLYFEVKNATAFGTPSAPQTPGLQINVPANLKKKKICQNPQILLF